jgi:hypothetical protein
LKLRGAIALALLVSAVAVAPAHAASTREEYAAQADPYCKAETQDGNRLWKRFVRANAHLRFHSAGNALESIGTRITQTNNQLRPIPPPPGDETLIANWLGIWDGIAHRWVLSASAYRLGKYNRVNHLFNTIDRLARQTHDLVAVFPFKDCAWGDEGMRTLELGVRLVLWFFVVFLVWLCIYGVASAAGSDDAQKVANNGMLVVALVFAVGLWAWNSRRTQRKP